MPTRPSHPPPPPPPGRRPGWAGGGFTLAELLIVVGILAALAAILLPTLGRARRQAAQLLCQSNLRQWDLAVIAYANENRGCLPRRGQGTQPTAVLARPEDWFNALPPLLGMEPYADLAARHAVPRPEDRGVWNCGEAVNVGEATFFSYAMNMRLSTWVAPEPDRIDRVGPTATMVFMADAPAGYCSVLPAAAPYSPVARHTGSVNVSFLDGHVASYAGNEVGCGTGDPLRDDVRWVVPGSPWAGPQ